ncbi:uncharacterized protein EV422DRAFT_189724 [Fimicolochytrium jonesii]|uniref:uncharacterized protein n=1 Tax=Fimicolochytrium jonesii TaxID=1396493 RepID=UPI0022FE1CEB|nr:uncharacterized protein EV422DRAFT_189724 [Fimicolochytrium jonesii]KAI8818097.1 hypothetical protein EV422DRAFT_189724 [Fimicolochytrium jonesii]
MNPPATFGEGRPSQDFNGYERPLPTLPQNQYRPSPPGSPMPIHFPVPPPHMRLPNPNASTSKPLAPHEMIALANTKNAKSGGGGWLKKVVVGFGKKGKLQDALGGGSDTGSKPTGNARASPLSLANYQNMPAASKPSTDPPPRSRQSLASDLNERSSSSLRPTIGSSESSGLENVQGGFHLATAAEDVHAPATSRGTPSSNPSHVRDISSSSGSTPALAKNQPRPQGPRPLSEAPLQMVEAGPPTRPIPGTANTTSQHPPRHTGQSLSGGSGIPTPVSGVDGAHVLQSGGPIPPFPSPPLELDGRQPAGRRHPNLPPFESLNVQDATGETPPRSPDLRKGGLPHHVDNRPPSRFSDESGRRLVSRASLPSLQSRGSGSTGYPKSDVSSSSGPAEVSRNSGTFWTVKRSPGSSAPQLAVKDSDILCPNSLISELAPWEASEISKEESLEHSILQEVSNTTAGDTGGGVGDVGDGTKKVARNTGSPPIPAKDRAPGGASLPASIPPRRTAQPFGTPTDNSVGREHVSLAGPLNSGPSTYSLPADRGISNLNHKGDPSLVSLPNMHTGGQRRMKSPPRWESLLDEQAGEPLANMTRTGASTERRESTGTPAEQTETLLTAPTPEVQNRNSVQAPEPRNSPAAHQPAAIASPATVSDAEPDLNRSGSEISESTAPHSEIVMQQVTEQGPVTTASSVLSKVGAAAGTVIGAVAGGVVAATQVATDVASLAVGRPHEHNTLPAEDRGEEEAHSIPRSDTAAQISKPKPDIVAGDDVALPPRGDSLRPAPLESSFLSSSSMTGSPSEAAPTTSAIEDSLVTAASVTSPQLGYSPGIPHRDGTFGQQVGSAQAPIAEGHLLSVSATPNLLSESPELETPILSPTSPFSAISDGTTVFGHDSLHRAADSLGRSSLASTESTAATDAPSRAGLFSDHDQTPSPVSPFEETLSPPEFAGAEISTDLGFLNPTGSTGANSQSSETLAVPAVPLLFRAMETPQATPPTPSPASSSHEDEQALPGAAGLRPSATARLRDRVKNVMAKHRPSLDGQRPSAADLNGVNGPSVAAAPRSAPILGVDDTKPATGQTLRNIASNESIGDKRRSWGHPKLSIVTQGLLQPSLIHHQQDPHVIQHAQPDKRASYRSGSTASISSASSTTARQSVRPAAPTRTVSQAPSHGSSDGPSETNVYPARGASLQTSVVRLLPIVDTTLPSPPVHVYSDMTDAYADDGDVSPETMAPRRVVQSPVNEGGAESEFFISPTGGSYSSAPVVLPATPIEPTFPVEDYAAQPSPSTSADGPSTPRSLTASVEAVENGAFVPNRRSLQVNGAIQHAYQRVLRKYASFSIPAHANPSLASIIEQNEAEAAKDGPGDEQWRPRDGSMNGHLMVETVSGRAEHSLNGMARETHFDEEQEATEQDRISDGSLHSFQDSISGDTISGLDSPAETGNADRRSIGEGDCLQHQHIGAEAEEDPLPPRTTSQLALNAPPVNGHHFDGPSEVNLTDARANRGPYKAHSSINLGAAYRGAQQEPPQQDLDKNRHLQHSISMLDMQSSSSPRDLDIPMDVPSSAAQAFFDRLALSRNQQQQSHQSGHGNASSSGFLAPGPMRQPHSPSPSSPASNQRWELEPPAVSSDPDVTYADSDDGHGQDVNSSPQIPDRPGSPYSFVSGASIRLTRNHPRFANRPGGAGSVTAGGVGRKSVEALANARSRDNMKGMRPSPQPEQPQQPQQQQQQQQQRDRRESAASGASTTPSAPSGAAPHAPSSSTSSVQLHGKQSGKDGSTQQLDQALPPRRDSADVRGGQMAPPHAYHQQHRQLHPAHGPAGSHASLLFDPSLHAPHHHYPTYYDPHVVGPDGRSSYLGHPHYPYGPHASAYLAPAAGPPPPGLYAGQPMVPTGYGPDGYATFDYNYTYPQVMPPPQPGYRVPQLQHHASMSMMRPVGTPPSGMMYGQHPPSSPHSVHRHSEGYDRASGAAFAWPPPPHLMAGGTLNRSPGGQRGMAQPAPLAGANGQSVAQPHPGTVMAPNGLRNPNAMELSPAGTKATPSTQKQGKGGQSPPNGKADGDKDKEKDKKKGGWKGIFR